MKKRIRHLVAQFLSLCVFSLVCSSSSFAQNTIPSKETVKIGVIVPLTGGGARRGGDIVKTISVLEPELNQHSTKYHYQFILEDGKCGEGSAAATAASKLINIDKTKFLITDCSGETMQAAPLAQRAGVLLFTVGASHHDVRKLGVFRTFLDQHDAIEGFAKYIQRNVDGNIALLTEESSFTANIEDILSNALGARIVV